MKPISAYTAILNIIAMCVNKICAMGPFREEDAKSTFFVEPKLHRKLEVVSELLGLTKQEIYSKALRNYLNDGYLKDIDIESFIDEAI